MEIGKIIGENLLQYREKFGYTQEQIGDYLGVDRTMISKFENNQREISIVYLNKLADLYTIDLDDLMEEDSFKKDVNMAFAFRNEGISNLDIKGIADFQKIVKNYLQMKELDNE